MPNNRLYFAVKAPAFSKLGSTSYTVAHGVQSVSVSTNFNLEAIQEYGQLEIYENIENIPDVQVSMEKVIDGYPLLYHLATNGSTASSLAGRQNVRTTFSMAIFDDDQESASGTPISQLICSGMYLNSVTYTIPVDGNCTEAITLVGNNKEWKTSNFTLSGTLFNNQDQPLAVTSGWGGIQRRENVIFGGSNDTILPTQIPGISSSGTNNRTAGEFGAHIQTITVSTDFGREELNELGRRSPYFRYASLPIQVTCDIEVTTTQGDNISATEEGYVSAGVNLVDETIKVKLQDGTFLNLGTKNKLSSVSFGGGDTGGGNDTCTYSYTNNNSLSVTHPMDPSPISS